MGLAPFRRRISYKVGKSLTTGQKSLPVLSSSIRRPSDYCGGENVGCGHDAPCACHRVLLVQLTSVFRSMSVIKCTHRTHRRGLSIFVTMHSA